MKKITLLLALALTSGVAGAQKSVAFKIKFLPNHAYKMSNNMNLDMLMKLPDSLAKKANMPNGMNMNLVMYQAITVKTGVKEADGGFPYELKYDSLAAKMTMNGGETPMPSRGTTGSILNGKCTADGKLHIDTIVNGKTDKATQLMIKEMVNKMMDGVKFPDKPMTVGESFTQDMPFPIPMLGADSKIAIKCIYKLTDVKGNLAYFDVALTFDMNLDKTSAGNNLSLKGTGRGNGKMIYAIDKNFAVGNKSNLDMQMDIQVANKMNMHADMKATYDNKIDISAN